MSDFPHSNISRSGGGARWWILGAIAVLLALVFALTLAAPVPTSENAASDAVPQSQAEPVSQSRTDPAALSLQD
jgi:hypothetical protein